MTQHGQLSPPADISGRLIKSLTQTVGPVNPAPPLFSIDEQGTRQRLWINSHFDCMELMLLLLQYVNPRASKISRSD